MVGGREHESFFRPDVDRLHQMTEQQQQEESGGQYPSTSPARSPTLPEARPDDRLPRS